MSARYEVEVTVISAKDLKNINWRHGKLKPYAVVWVDSASKSSTHVDDSGDHSPYWDQKLTVPFNSSLEDSTLYLDVVHAKNDDEDTKPLIGSAKIPLKEVVNDVGLGSFADLKLDLKRPSGRPHGKIEVTVSVRDPRNREQDHYYAPPYGVPPPGSRDYATPYGAPPPSGYQYYGHPAGYGQGQYYGQQPVGYGQGQYYGEAQHGYVEEEKKSKFGGMGTGLAVGVVAGAVGGIALAEGFDALEENIADDVEERIEEGDGEYEEED